jgi:hypothetical protein
MATCEGCCHLTGAMLNLAAEAADRARIGIFDPPKVHGGVHKRPGGLPVDHAHAGVPNRVHGGVQAHAEVIPMLRPSSVCAPQNYL